MDPISQPDREIWRINRLEGLLNQAMNEATQFDLQMEVAHFVSIPPQGIRDPLEELLDHAATE